MNWKSPCETRPVDIAARMMGLYLHGEEMALVQRRIDEDRFRKLGVSLACLPRTRKVKP